MKTFYACTSSLTLTLILSPGVLAQDPTSTNDISPTQVVIVGTLHDYHKTNSHYSLETLLGILVACKPQAILVELPATKRQKPIIQNGRLPEEYAKKNEFWASQQAAEKLNISLHPFDMDRLDDWREETRYWQRQRQADKEYAAFLKEHQEDEEFAELRAHDSSNQHLNQSIQTFAENGTPEIINSEAFDSISRAKKQLKIIFEKALQRAIRAHPEKKALQGELEFMSEEWRRRNECMAQNIERYARQYQSKRIAVVVGAEHRYLLRDLLRNKSTLTVKEYWELR